MSPSLPKTKFSVPSDSDFSRYFLLNNLLSPYCCSCKKTTHKNFQHYHVIRFRPIKNKKERILTFGLYIPQAQHKVSRRLMCSVSSVCYSSWWHLLTIHTSVDSWNQKTWVFPNAKIMFLLFCPSFLLTLSRHLASCFFARRRKRHLHLGCHCYRFWMSFRSSALFLVKVGFQTVRIPQESDIRQLFSLPLHKPM